MANAPTAIVLAGINGSGKTTASRAILAETLKLMTFVNADVIALGLCGFDPNRAALEAGRIMLERLHKLAERREDFAFETTLAARTYAGWLKSLRQNGYDIHLLYFWLKSPELAIGRVANRVKAGGHHVPDDTIRQRYSRSIRNFFELYRPVATTWKVYDNSGEVYQFVAEGGDGFAETIHQTETWQRINEGARHE